MVLFHINTFLLSVNQIKWATQMSEWSLTNDVRVSRKGRKNFWSGLLLQSLVRAATNFAFCDVISGRPIDVFLEKINFSVAFKIVWARFASPSKKKSKVKITSRKKVAKFISRNAKKRLLGSIVASRSLWEIYFLKQLLLFWNTVTPHMQELKCVNYITTMKYIADLK